MNIDSLHQIFLESSGICTDTRKIEENCLFIALKGENFDGNRFAQEALEKGAKTVVVDDPNYHQENNGTVLVADCLKTLQNLATYHRNYLDIPIIGLTGSNGKTTTKELIHAVLAKAYRCVATRGNLNNHIGVPLTLLSLKEDTEIGVIEMGANHIGEIAKLCEIARPDYGYITNFGKAHLEGFGSIEGVVQGKSELYAYIKRHQGTILVNGKDPKQMELTSESNRIVFNSSNGDLNMDGQQRNGFTAISISGELIQSKLLGEYNFNNISAAIAFGRIFDVPLPQIREAIEAYEPKMNRSEIRKLQSHTLILDAYNANPTSVLAALENFKNMPHESKAVILGDMFELGKDAAQEHEAIVTYLTRFPEWKVFLVGKQYHATKTTADHIVKMAEFDTLKSHIPDELAENSLLLIKGSRGMALERCLNLF